MALPTASTPGYSLFRGKVGCDCVIRFLLAAERLGKAMKLIVEELDIIQLTGDASASQGVHSLGSAFDTVQRSTKWVWIFRNMGAAFFPREGGTWAATDNEHGHGVIRCPHDDRSAYQHLAYRRGYNGLGQGWYGGQYLWGYGGKDTFWRPSVIRTTADGIAWATAEATRIEDIVLQSDIDKIEATIKAAVPAAVWAYLITSPTDPDYKTTAYSWLRGTAVRVAKVDGTTAATAGDVDALAKSVSDLTSLVTTLTASVAEANDKVDALTAKVDALPKA